MRISTSFLPQLTLSQLTGSKAVNLTLRAVALVALAVLFVKVVLPKLIPNQVRPVNPPPMPPPILPILEPEEEQELDPAPVASTAQPPQLPVEAISPDEVHHIVVVPTITILDVCNFLIQNPVPEERLHGLDPTKVRMLGTLALLPQDILLIICQFAGPKFFQGSRVLRNVGVLVSNEYSYCKTRVERHFVNAVLNNNYDRCVELIAEMQARWTGNGVFESRFLRMNLNMQHPELFGRLIELSDHATLPPDIRRLLLFKMIEVPFKSLNSNFIQRNILVMLQVRTQEHLQFLLYKMFVEVKLFEPFPWYTKLPPIERKDVSLDLLSEWMDEFIARMNSYQVTWLRNSFQDLLLGLDGKDLHNWGIPLEDAVVENFDVLKSAAEASFTPGLKAKCSSICLNFLNQPDSKRIYQQEPITTDFIRDQSSTYESDFGNLIRSRFSGWVNGRSYRKMSSSLAWIEKTFKDEQNVTNDIGQLLQIEDEAFVKLSTLEQLAKIRACIQDLMEQGLLKLPETVPALPPAPIP